jgi:hypothetical protein
MKQTDGESRFHCVKLQGLANNMLRFQSGGYFHPGSGIIALPTDF